MVSLQGRDLRFFVETLRACLVQTYLCLEFHMSFQVRSVREVVKMSLLLFLYTVSRDRSTHRVYVWRKLKLLNAHLLHDSVWALPKTAENLERFQHIAADIDRLGGNSLLWEAQLATTDQEEALYRLLR